MFYFADMISTFSAFHALFLSTLLIQIGTGLFNNYMGLRLSADSVSEIWIGTLLSAYYLGLVFGARVGHHLIIRVGHVRACATAAALAICLVLLQTLIDEKLVWLLLRFCAGMAMVVQFIVIESWLNEQAENTHRGRVMSVYLLMSGIGTALGQLSITMYPTLDLRPLIFVAMCQALALLPIVLTTRKLPAPQLPAPIDLAYFFKQVPQSLLTILLAGNLCAAFYGLAAVYAVKQNLSTGQVAVFTATTVVAGLLSQWPMGWLSDRVNRGNLVRVNALILVGISMMLWGWIDWPYWMMLLLAAGMGSLQFTLYGLASGLGNDRIDSERRVGLTAMMLMAYGAGACLGPTLAGTMMRLGGSHMLYVFSSACALLLFVTMRSSKK
jgi:MFS family permease